MAEVTAGELLIRIKADAKKLEDALNKSGTSVNAFSQKMESVSKKLTTAGMKMSLAVTAPLTLIGKKSLDAAMDVVESENLFEVSMGNMADAARKWSEEFSESVGLNEYNVRKQVGTFNVMLTSMGLTEQAALDMSEKMTQLAYDMASFYNIDVEDAFIKIQGGITGEAESLKRLGIIVNETAVKQTAYKNGIAEVGQELTENQKIMARYQTIMEATSKSHGDMARTLDSPANQLRVFKEQIQLAAIELGKGLIPMMQEVIKGVQPLVEWFTNLNDTQKEWIVKLGVLAASGGPLMLATGQVLNFANSIKKANTAMKGSILFSTGTGALPIFGILGGVINLGTAAYGLTDAIKGLKDGSMDWREALIKLASPMVAVLEKIEFFKKLLPEWWHLTDEQIKISKELNDTSELTAMKLPKVREALQGITEVAEETIESVDDLITSLYELYNINQSITEKTWDFEDAVKAANEALKEHGEGSREHEEALFKVQDQLESLQKVVLEGIENDKMTLHQKSELQKAFIDTALEAVKMGTMTAEQFEKMAKEAGIKQEIISSKLENLGKSADDASGKITSLRDYIAELRSKEITITTNLVTTRSEWVQSAAGKAQIESRKQSEKQTGGEVVNTGIIPDLDIIGIKGEWLLNKQLVNAIKTSRTDSMGITASGGKSTGDVYLNVTIPGMVIREDQDIDRLTEALYDKVNTRMKGLGLRW